MGRVMPTLLERGKREWRAGRGSFQLNILMDELLQGGTRKGMAAVEEKSRRHDTGSRGVGTATAHLIGGPG